MTFRALAVLPAAAVLTAASWLSVPQPAAWPALGTAGPFLRAQLENMAHNRYAAAWTLLYPAHRQLVTRGEYVACELARPFAAPLRSAKTVGVRRAAVHVPGVPQTVPGVAVTERIALTWAGRDPITFTHTFHLVPVHGHWTWLLSAQRYRLYSGAGCKIGPAL